MSDLFDKHVVGDDDAAELHSYEKEISRANVLRVKVKGTSPQGGDASHGGWCELELADAGGTCWDAVVTEHGVLFRVEGDSEVATLAEALRFAADTLMIMGHRQP